jgi:hypothetical protein
VDAFEIPNAQDTRSLALLL